ncbi:MAG TPA: chorismate-binding protein [Brumimicrobium sp.]|nr:chorismate-binding protein [Brumimicrobium sp.]
MAILAIQFPNEELKIYEGKWHAEKLENLKDDHFFITDFTKDKMYFFEKEKEIDVFTDENLSFNDDGSVFFVNGRYYLQGLEIFIDYFQENDIQKAIYSRIKEVERGKQPVFQTLKALAATYSKEALVYLASDEKFGTWVGATPEVLVQGDEEKLYSMALAGTKAEESTAWTEKEEVEHQYVVDYVKEKISAHSPKDLTVFPTETVKNGAVYHLRTNYEFQIESNKWNALINDMHPTPAVCGTPMEKAQAYILEMEPHERAFYAGLIGWKGEEDLKVYVNLRCMQILQTKYALYLGGGITKDSDIGAEWRETEAKSETLLAVINKD